VTALRRDHQAAFDALEVALTQVHAEGVTCVLRVIGNPGGLIHFRKGVVIAVESAGAPGVEALLLRSGRVGEDDWTTALEHDQRVALLARRGVGPVELRLAAMMATRDSLFAIAVGGVEEFELDEEPATDVLAPNRIGSYELLRETARRLGALDALPFPLSPYGDRVAAVGVDSDLTTGQLAVLANASGRRSARDIAFAVGRGLYSVTVEISHLLRVGILEITRNEPIVTAPARLRSLRPRHEAVTADGQ
jgi:hypothetical protein